MIILFSPFVKNLLYIKQNISHYIIIIQNIIVIIIYISKKIVMMIFFACVIKMTEGEISIGA